ncbi:hypothetical protein [Tahibacter amnicola]|uniref:Uncharacterized protein n=1 Tax=Tahibacter amnicola TaxID=2976241 RepID=A0ABY6BH37_9GAMM|nr:hypothetical protein [Tahibacter amnicola]UXI68638.1 hypothetical protein N4264_03025 [Tahibacter amnicola]
MNKVSRGELESLVNFSAQERLVRDSLAAALAEPLSRLRFLGRYTSWNGFFGSGVAALAGKIGRSRRLFLDPDQPVRAVADRSVYVASFFFDAARDEFDDHDSVHRDTHRCLAQATLKGLLDYETPNLPALADPRGVNAILDDPEWLAALNARVAEGYGARSSDDLPSIFAAIGYHLGSELLADREFSIIDETLRNQAPDLVRHLLTTRISIAGQEHVAYQWIAIHSGHGGGAEADHFEWATQGARLALRFAPQDQHAALKQELHRGFIAFAADHRRFFEHVNHA